jgi:hypothetical protein
LCNRIIEESKIALFGRHFSLLPLEGGGDPAAAADDTIVASAPYYAHCSNGPFMELFLANFGEHPFHDVRE